MTGILGKKLGMTQIFSPEGNRITVTVIEAGPCSILQINNNSILVGFQDVKESKISKARLGLFKKTGLKPKRVLKEISKKEGVEYKLGDDLKVDMFKNGDFIDVTGISIGKGFQGGMKRWHWHGGPGSHGSTSHRRVGSMGSTTTPGRVWKGHHLPGHMGNDKVTVQNIRVVKIDPDNNLLLVKGAVPGHKNSILLIRKSLKKTADK